MIQQGQAQKASKHSFVEGLFSIDIRIENDQVVVFAGWRQVAAPSNVGQPSASQPSDRPPIDAQRHGSDASSGQPNGS